MEQIIPHIPVFERGRFHFRADRPLGAELALHRQARDTKSTSQRARAHDEETTGQALGQLYGGVHETMQKAGTLHESVRLSVDFRTRTLTYLVSASRAR